MFVSSYLNWALLRSLSSLGKVSLSALSLYYYMACMGVMLYVLCCAGLGEVTRQDRCHSQHVIMAGLLVAVVMVLLHCLVLQ